MFNKSAVMKERSNGSVMALLVRGIVRNTRPATCLSVWRGSHAGSILPFTDQRSEFNPEATVPSLYKDASGHFEQVYPGDPRFRIQPKEITTHTGKKIVLEKGEVIADVHFTLEWTLPAPPPFHQFEESPIVKETH